MLFSSSSSLPSSTGLIRQWPWVTWPTTVSSSPMPVSDNCVLLTLEHSLSVGHAVVLEVGPSPPQDHKSGTVCRPISDYVGYHTASSGGYCKHFYSAVRPWRSELFLTAPNRNILTYLLTYLDRVCSALQLVASKMWYVKVILTLWWAH